MAELPTNEKMSGSPTSIIEQVNSFLIVRMNMRLLIVCDATTCVVKFLTRVSLFCKRVVVKLLEVG